MANQVLAKSLPILCGMLARKLNLRFRMSGSRAYTDFESVVIPAADINDPDFAVRAIGFTLHEGGHNRFTDPSLRPTPPDDNANQSAFDVKAAFGTTWWLYQALEDVRMETQVMRLYPGARKHLARLVQNLVDGEGWFEPVTNEDSPLSILQAYVLYRGRGEILGQHALLDWAQGAKEQLEAVLPQATCDAIEKALFSIQQAESTADSAKIAGEITDLVKDLLDQPPEDNNQDGSSSDDGSDAGDQDSDQSTADGGQGTQSDTGDSGNDAYPDDGSDASSGNQPADGSQAGKADEDGQANTSSSGKPDDQNSDPGGAGGTGAGDGNAVAKAAAQMLSGEDTGRIADISDKLQEEIQEIAQNGRYSDNSLGAYDSDPEVATDTADPGEIRRGVDAAARAAYVRLIGLLEAQNLDDTRFETDGIEIEPERVHRLLAGEIDLFREEDPAPAVNTAVHVLLDRSGSMGYEVDLAVKTTAAAGMALERIPDAEVAVSLFPGRSGATEVLTRPGERPSRTLRRYGVHASGGTPMADALWAAATQMAWSDAERKLVVVITDGMPNRLEATRDVIARLRRENVEVIALGIGSDARSGLPSVFDRDYAFVDSVDGLAEALFGALRSRLTAKAA